jgi:hypothetical protein
VRSALAHHAAHRHTAPGGTSTTCCAAQPRTAHSAHALGLRASCPCIHRVNARRGIRELYDLTQTLPSKEAGAMPARDFVLIIGYGQKLGGGRRTRRCSSYASQRFVRIHSPFAALPGLVAV